jgi:hypothetical protein
VKRGNVFKVKLGFARANARTPGVGCVVPGDQRIAHVGDVPSSVESARHWTKLGLPAISAIRSISGSVIALPIASASP